jgi:quercetin dioxygenase-like cupin family protein
MKQPPSSPDRPAVFDLEATIGQLRQEEQYINDGQASRTLIRATDLRMVVVALRAGKSIAEHHANVTASVQTVSGQLRVQMSGERVDVPAGHVLVMAMGQVHDVYAETDCAFVLTLGWPASK